MVTRTYLKFLIGCALLFVFSTSFTQVSVTGSAPKFVKNGQRFQLTYHVKNGNPEQLAPPEFTDFAFLGGPSQGSSSQMTVVNGKMTQSVNYSFTYVLQAKNEGKFTIEPAVFVVDGKEYKTNAVTVEVVKANQQSSSTSSGKTGSEGIGGEDLYLKILVNKRTMYQGEPVSATVKIYSKVDLVGFDEFSLPQFNGFWKEDVETSNQVNLQEENIDGILYRTAILQKFVLVPQKSGQLIIDPVEIGCVVRQRIQSSNRRRSLFDDFFARSQNVQKKVKSKSIRVRVKQLPAGAPASFTGAVGSYKLSASLTKKEVQANKSVTLKTKISGAGNLKLIDLPSLNLPPDLELYDPEVKNSFKVTANGISGSKTVNYLTIPRYAGIYKLPAIEFTYFDVNQKQYKTLKKGPFSLNVLAGDGTEDVATIQQATVSQKDVKKLNTDIRYIQTGIVSVDEKTTTWFGTTSFYLSYGLPLLGFGVLCLVFYKKEKDQSDVKSYKAKKANKLIQQKLKIAKRHLEEQDSASFHKELLSGVFSYLGDKLRMEQSDLTKEKITATLESKEVSSELITDLQSLISTVEMAQYASSATTSMEKTYSEAERIMEQLIRL
ncbi:MAG: BatD family protein [Cyclobacteriaceae bacterium]